MNPPILFFTTFTLYLYIFVCTLFLFNFKSPQIILNEQIFEKICHRALAAADDRPLSRPPPAPATLLPPRILMLWRRRPAAMPSQRRDLQGMSNRGGGL